MSLAQQNGLLWQTVWNANPDLQAVRGNPNVLMPGDIVQIPDLVEKHESGATELRHKFVKKGARAKFRLLLERYDTPIRNRQYFLDVDGERCEGKTDNAGFLEVFISPTARHGQLEIPDEGLRFPLEFGHLDPVSETTGLQHRLENLGFLTTGVTGELDEPTIAALIAFQSSANLPANGELSDDTRAALIRLQDRQHASRPRNDAPSHDTPNAEASESGLVDEEIWPDLDHHADRAEMERFTSTDELEGDGW